MAREWADLILPISWPLYAAGSNRDPLNDVARDPSLAAVEQPSRSQVGEVGEVLRVLQRDALRQKVGDRRESEGMGGKAGQRGGVSHAAFDPPAHVVGKLGVPAMCVPSRTGRASGEPRSGVFDAVPVSGPTDVGTGRPKTEDVAKLSEIVDVLNERFGTDFTEKDQLLFDQVVGDMKKDFGSDIVARRHNGAASVGKNSSRKYTAFSSSYFTRILILVK